MKMTEWFPADVKPVHIGVYEVQNIYGPKLSTLFNYWTGDRWTGSSFTIDGVLLQPSKYGFTVQERIWRGLAEQPK